MNHLQQAAHAERQLSREQKTAGRPPTNRYSHPTLYGYLHELTHKAVVRKLDDAEEQLTYWTAAKARAFRDHDRTQAAARVLLWTGEVEAIRRRLREMNRTEEALAS
jgi:hypothetical protein